MSDNLSPTHKIEDRDSAIIEGCPACDPGKGFETLTKLQRIFVVLRNFGPNSSRPLTCQHRDAFTALLQHIVVTMFEQIDNLQDLTESIQFLDADELPIDDAESLFEPRKVEPLEPGSLVLWNWLSNLQKQLGHCRSCANCPADVLPDVASQLYSLKIRAYPEKLQVNLIDEDYQSLSPTTPGYAVKHSHQLEDQLRCFETWLDNFEIRWDETCTCLEIVYNEEELRKALKESRLRNAKNCVGPRWKLRRTATVKVKKEL